MAIKKGIIKVMTKGKAPKRRIPIWAKAVAVYTASIVFILAAIFGTFSFMFAGKIYPRISVADVVVGGLTAEAAKAKLAEELPKKALKPAIVTDGQGQSFTLKPEEAKVAFDIDKSVTNAMAIGRQSSWLNSLSQKITTPLFGYAMPAALTYDEPQLNGFINSVANKIDVAEKNADLSIKDGVVSITPAQTGQAIDAKQLREQLLANFGNAEDEPIELKIKTKEPAVKEEDAQSAKKVAEVLLSQPIEYLNKDQKFTATPTVIGGWLQTKIVSGVLSSKLELELNEQAIEKYVAELAAAIDQEPQDARLAMVNGTLTITQSSRDGLKLKRDVAKTDTIRLLTIRKEVPEAALVTTVPTDAQATSSPTTATEPALAENQVALEVEVKQAEVTDANINSLGIKERIAISASEYKGSPSNRQENIRLGTKLFNGIILAPGEQFSAVKSLGRIDESAGFKPELVIKQDQLIPEVGGGLCQVSTTLFRAAMNAGLAIDERRNHRFRVSYYETKPSNPDPEDYVTLNAKTLVGMDATIYDPSPDFKFTNDTGNYILIQGKIEGTRVTFELFGTKDGRQTAIDGPYITSTTEPPAEPLYLDDPTLPAGETKLKEKAVAGSKTYFRYIVTKDGKELHKKTFTSTYVPWQAKYYRGTGPAATPSPAPTPATTPAP